MIVKFIKSLFKSRSGMILPMALVLLAAGAFMVVPGLFSVNTLLTTNRIAEENSQAYYAADAGIQLALWQLKNGQTVSSPIESINGMTVTLTDSVAQQPGGTKVSHTIKSAAAKDGKVFRTIYMAVDAEVFKSPIEFAIAATDGDIHLGKSWVSAGFQPCGAPIAANGMISYDHVQSWVFGYAQAESWGGYPHRDCGETTLSTPMSFATINKDLYIAAADSGQILVGDQTFQNTVKGNTHVKGDLTVKGTLWMIDGSTIWVDGNVEFFNNAIVIVMGTSGYFGTENDITFGNNFTSPSTLTWLILGTGTFNAWNNGAWGSIYAPDADIVFKNGGFVYGAVIGKSVTMHNDQWVFYPSSPIVIDFINSSSFTTRGYSAQ